MSVYVLDSYALMAFFQGEPNAGQVRELIHKAQRKECVLKLSSINWGELYYTSVRYKGKLAAEQMLAMLAQYQIEVVDIDRPIVYQAAVFKSQYALSYADCFAAALAKKEEAPLVTGDPEFKLLAHEITVRWIKSRKV